MDFRIVLGIAGVVYLAVGLLTDEISEWARRMKPGDYVIVYGGPYIRDDEQRVEHVLFRSMVMIIWGIVNIILAVVLPADFLDVYGIFSFASLGLAGFILAIVIFADAVDRDTSAEGLSEEEKEKLRERD